MSEILTTFTKKEHPYKMQRSINWGNRLEFVEDKILACYVCKTWYHNVTYRHNSCSIPGCVSGNAISVFHLKRIGRVSYILPSFHRKCLEIFKLCPPTN